MSNPEDREDQPQRPLSEAERAAMWAEHWSWVRYILLSAADGMAIGALVAVVLIRLNIHDIATLLENSGHANGYAALLIGGFAHTFGMAAVGSAIWLRAKGTDA